MIFRPLKKGSRRPNKPNNVAGFMAALGISALLVGGFVFSSPNTYQESIQISDELPVNDSGKAFQTETLEVFVHKPTISSVTEKTYSEIGRITGTHEPGTSIIVNNKKIETEKNKFVWVYEPELISFGEYFFEISSQDESGNNSIKQKKTIYKCTLGNITCDDQRIDIADYKLFRKNLIQDCVENLNLTDLNEDGVCDDLDQKDFVKIYKKEQRKRFDTTEEVV